MAKEDKQLLEAEAEFNRFYKLSLWWVNSREKLKKIGLGILLGIESIILLAVFWTFIDTYFISYNAEQTAVAEMVALGQSDLRAYSVARAAQPLVPERPIALAVGDGRYDLYASITNPNTDWMAEFTYVFTSSAGDTEEKTGFILPNETKPAVVFSWETEVPPRSVDFSIKETQWRRIDKSLAPDYELFERERRNFTLSDVSFQPRVLDSDGNALPGRVTFTVKNNTAYSYYDPVFYILLSRGPSVVGVNSTTLSELDAGEEQEVVVNWFGTTPQASKVDVIPEVNLFDPAVYKPLKGNGALDSRLNVPLR